MATSLSSPKNSLKTQAARLNGGELGWSTPDQFVGAFAETMQVTEEGQFSEPFISQFGWHVLLVEGRREEDMSDEARRNMALELLHKRRFEEAAGVAERAA